VLNRYFEKINVLSGDNPARRFDLQNITSTANGANELSGPRSQGIAKFLNTLSQGAIGNRASLPNLFDQLIFADQPPAVLGKEFQDFVGLWAQVNRLTRPDHFAAIEVEGKLVEKPKSTATVH
jgi:hypothetical protein